MRPTRSRLALAGALGLAVLTGGVVVGPAVASAAGGASPGAAVGDRLGRIKDALQGLVDDRTLTPAQRDKVASTLNDKLPPPGHGRGGPGRGPLGVGLDAAAKALGMSTSDLMTELRSGKSLADVAGEKNVPLPTLTGALQKAEEDELAQAVKDGKLTQAQADAKKADLAKRIADQVQKKGVGPGRGHGWGPGGNPAAPDDEPSSGATEPSSYTA